MNPQTDEDAEIERICEVWPTCLVVLRAAIDNMQKQMETVTDADAAFSIVTLLLLREVFWRQTVMAAINRADSDIMAWIDTEYEDWNEDKSALDELAASFPC